VRNDVNDVWAAIAMREAKRSSSRKSSPLLEGDFEDQEQDWIRKESPEECTKANSRWKGQGRKGLKKV